MRAKSATTYRSAMDLQLTVLRACTSPLIISEVCVKVRLTNSQAIDLLNLLGSSGMIETKKSSEVIRVDRRSERSDAVFFVRTNKGAEAIAEYENLLMFAGDSLGNWEKLSFKLVFDALGKLEGKSYLGKIAEEVGRSSTIAKSALEYLISRDLARPEETVGNKSFFSRTELGERAAAQYRRFIDLFAPVEGHEYKKAICLTKRS